MKTYHQKQEDCINSCAIWLQFITQYPTNQLGLQLWIRKFTKFLCRLKFPSLRNIWADRQLYIETFSKGQIYNSRQSFCAQFKDNFILRLGTVNSKIVNALVICLTGKLGASMLATGNSPNVKGKTATENDSIYVKYRCELYSIQVNIKILSK